MTDEEYAERYPEHWKTKVNKDKLEHARQFLSFLEDQELIVAREVERRHIGDDPYETVSTRALPFLFIGVDPEKYSAEKDRLLEDYQRENGR